MNTILKITKKIRNNVVLKYIEPKEKHLDIGCGKEKFLLNKSPCRIKVGLDKLLSQKIEKKIFLNDQFDYITMVAVIEHLDYPKEVLKECFRLLKKDGLLLITTPTKLANKLMKIYAPNTIHKGIFNKNQITELLFPHFKIRLYKKFEFGLNQLIIARKSENYA